MIIAFIGAHISVNHCVSIFSCTVYNHDHKSTHHRTDQDSESQRGQMNFLRSVEMEEIKVVPTSTRNQSLCSFCSSIWLIRPGGTDMGCCEVLWGNLCERKGPTKEGGFEERGSMKWESRFPGFSRAPQHHPMLELRDTHLSLLLDSFGHKL